MHQPDLQAAVDSLRSGGIVAYPTESVYGLGCDPKNESALQNLLALKHRDVSKGMIIIASNYAQIACFIAPHGDRLKQLLRTSAPTPTTWVVDAAEGLSPLLTGGRTTLAVRITDHPVASALCRLFGGPITSTSANVSSQPPARSAADVRARFPHGIDCLVEGSTGELDQPTQIIDARCGSILR